jgi:tetratricopeptide (TPR) repeat protein
MNLGGAWLVNFSRMALLSVCTAVFPHVSLAQDSATPAIKGSEAYQRAFALVTQRRYDAALEAAKALDESNPKQQAERLAIAAWTEFAQCRFESAEEKARGALMLVEDQPLALMLIARLLASEGSLRQAASTALAAARADPNNPVILWRVQEVLGVARKKNEERVELLERLVALGGSPELQKPLDTARDTLAMAKKINDRDVNAWSEDSASRAEFVLVTDPQTRTNDLEYALPNGAKRRFRVDTGAYLLVLTAPTATALEKEALTSSGTINPRSGDRALLPKFALGDLRWENVLAAVVQSGRDLLPLTLFPNSIVVLDFKGQRLTVFTDREAFEKEWEERLKRSSALRYRTFNNTIVVTCSLLSDGGKETRGAVLLSTGMWESQFSVRFGEQWRREQNIVIEPPQVGAQPSLPFPMLVNPSMRAGAITFSIPRLPLVNQDAAQQLLGIEFAGIVGMNFLHHCEYLIFDTQQRIVRFGPPQPKK